jgi:NADH:ubiquinone oxidoreductase subunit 3 (subunit A)
MTELGGSIRISTESNNVRNTGPCMKDEKYAVYVRAQISRGSIPTPSPSVQPTTAEQGSSIAPTPFINLSLDTAAQAAVIIAFMTAGLGLFYCGLREKDPNSKAVILIYKSKITIQVGLIGGEVATSVVLLVKLYESRFEVWGVVITLMRLMHVFIAFGIIATISGPACLRKYANFSALLDHEHMAFNAKMYVLASVFALFDINALVLLPWRDSPFARTSFGLPNISLFRTCAVHFHFYCNSHHHITSSVLREYR